MDSARRLQCAIFLLSSLLPQTLEAEPHLIQDVTRSSQPLPFVVLHGSGEACKQQSLTAFTLALEEMTGAVGICIEIGNGIEDSLLLRLDKQVNIVCEQMKKMTDLHQGYNLVGLSQGALLGRAVIELCDDGPPVNNFVSLGGPHAGVASVPLCHTLKVCELVALVIKPVVYTSCLQNHLAPTGYVKIPTDLDAYYSNCKFLPMVNNELPERRNATYKQRFSAINHVVLIQFENDQILYPAETSWFGYFKDNDFEVLLPVEETDLYKEDWIGLRALDAAQKVTFVKFPGLHLIISSKEMEESIAPYLVLPDTRVKATVGRQVSFQL